MKKIILIECYILLFFQISISQNSIKLYDQLDFNIDKQLRLFIDSIHSKGNLTKYYVFVLNIYKFDTVKNNYCYSMSFIKNCIDYKLVNAKYYLKIDCNYILARFCKDFDTKSFKFNPIKDIDTNTEDKVISTLYPCDNFSFLSGSPEAIIFCKEDNKYSKTDYNNSYELPYEAAIIQEKAPVEIRRYIRKE